MLREEDEEEDDSEVEEARADHSILKGAREDDREEDDSAGHSTTICLGFVYV